MSSSKRHVWAFEVADAEGVHRIEHVLAGSFTKAARAAADRPGVAGIGLPGWDVTVTETASGRSTKAQGFGDRGSCSPAAVSLAAREELESRGFAPANVAVSAVAVVRGNGLMLPVEPGATDDELDELVTRLAFVCIDESSDLPAVAEFQS